MGMLGPTNAMELCAQLARSQVLGERHGLGLFVNLAVKTSTLVARRAAVIQRLCPASVLVLLDG